MLNALINAGVQPSEVKFKFTQDAFQAAAAFNADKKISAAVSWAPDIYTLSKVKGNRLLVSTSTANKLIADVWFARADFAKDNPDVIEGLVRGIFDSMEALKEQGNKQAVAKLMAAGYSIPETDALSMLGDAHSTNHAENREFFLNQNNPTNFERTWNTAYYLYKRIGVAGEKVDFDQVMDFSMIAKLGKEPKYAGQKDEYAPTCAGHCILHQERERRDPDEDRVIHFYPNLVRTDEEGGEDGKRKTVEEVRSQRQLRGGRVAKLAGQFGNARIIVEGTRIPP